MQNLSPNVLVCVTDQPSCLRLVDAGMKIAKQYGAPVKVVSILRPGPLNENTAEIMQKLYNICSRMGAEITIYFNDEPAITAAVHARKTNAVHIVSGAPGVDSNSFIETIKGLLPDLPVSIISADDDIYTFPALVTENITTNR